MSVCFNCLQKAHSKPDASGIITDGARDSVCTCDSGKAFMCITMLVDVLLSKACLTRATLVATTLMQ